VSSCELLVCSGTLGTEQLMRDQASTTGSCRTAVAAGSAAASAAAAASALPAAQSERGSLFMHQMAAGNGDVAGPGE
jgi:hypothetical protein